MSFPIHAVYTWIDASDKRRQSERAKWLQQYQIGESVRRLPVDFVEGEPRHTELYFSLHALQVFAPWIQTVWIVTQRPHVPAFLDEFHVPEWFTTTKCLNVPTCCPPFPPEPLKPTCTVFLA